MNLISVIAKIAPILGSSLCIFHCVGASTFNETFHHQGREREYVVHVPRSYDPKTAIPLVFVFHGGGGNAEQIARFTGFNQLSDQHDFIVIYPEAIEGHWNDGRDGEAFRKKERGIDDVDFTLALLRHLQGQYSIDPNRIFATGVSNGGIFCQRLAIEHSETFAAVATVIGGIAEPLAKDFQPTGRISVLIMNGTEDPLVPYQGGEVTLPGFAKFFRTARRGRVLSTDDAIALWVQHNKLNTEPDVERFPDTDHDDGASVERNEWRDTVGGFSVVLYKIIGGGHSYPGGAQYLPKRVIGNTCQDINASQIIWDFFATHSKA